VTRHPRTSALPPGRQLPQLASWDAIFAGPARAALEATLPAWLRARRWFGGKARPLRTARVVAAIPAPLGERGARLTLMEARYAQGRPEPYSVPLTWSPEAQPQAASVLARLTVAGVRGALFGAEADPVFARGLLEAIARGARFVGARGEVVAWSTSAFARLARGAARLEPRLLSAEQSNTSIRFGERLILKLFRRTGPGPNPDLEIGSYLTAVARFRHTPPVLGGIEYRPRGGEPWSLGILQGFVRNRGDAWSHALAAVEGFRARAAAGRGAPPDLLETGPLAPAREPLAPAARRLLGGYGDGAELLGRRTAQLHRALAAHPEVRGFSVERFAPRDRLALREEVRAGVADAFALLRRRRRALDPEGRRRAAAILGRERELIAGADWLAERPLTALRTRIHGDYHLGQLLWTGRDFMIIDFEGEPARPLAERRARLSPLRDVAGMLRSFHYAAFHGLPRRDDDEAWARAWQRWVSGAFLRGYLAAARGAPFLPRDGAELAALLELFLLEKAVYELAYELNNRPDWVGIPLQGIADRLRTVDGAGRGRRKA